MMVVVSSTLIKLIMWPNIKKFVKKHQKKILTTLVVIGLGYLLFNYATSEDSVKLSAFCKAIKAGYV